MSYFPQASQWLAKVQALEPRLYHEEVTAAGAVSARQSDQAFAGWEIANAGTMEEVESKFWKQGEAFTLDFENHQVGHFHFELSVSGEMDAPVRLRLVFAELPLELGRPFDPFTGGLSRAWLQDELITLDIVPGIPATRQVKLSRRYAFRFVRMEIQATGDYSLRFQNIGCLAVSSADISRLPIVSLPSPWKEIDEVSYRTLKNCMQRVFEDGPKRDRRLWIGDLRLQAMANSVTFQNYDLVKRCLYLIAGLADDEGMVSGCVYEEPEPQGSSAKPLDYILLFGPILRGYLGASGDRETAEDLWTVVLRQLDFGWCDVDGYGHWHDNSGQWIFVDWNAGLLKEGCLSAILAFAIGEAIALGEELGHGSDVQIWKGRLDFLKAATKEKFWDVEKGVAVCGNQISWMTQAWMIVGGILSIEEGAGALRQVMDSPLTLRPVTPYGYHTVVEALMRCGLEEEASGLLVSLWGGMIDAGASTFWEVWDPENYEASPYGNPLLNSACHAWSCTPAYFIRSFPSLAGTCSPLAVYD